MNFQGTFAYHAKTMKNKFDAIAIKLRQASLSVFLSRVFYNSFYLPSVRYSLPVTSMTDAQLHSIQSKLTASALNKLGYNRIY